MSDINPDGVINFFDISPGSGFTYWASQNDQSADINGDGSGNYFVLTPYNTMCNSQAYGRAMSDANLVSGPDNIIGYAGYHWDEELGMWLSRHRVYDPELGRWMQRDPAGYVDGMSLYAYVRSNPFALVDPTGLFPEFAMNIKNQVVSKIHESIDDVANAVQDHTGFIGGIAAHSVGVVAHDAVGFADGVVDIVDGLDELQNNPTNTVAGKLAVGIVNDKMNNPLAPSETAMDFSITMVTGAYDSVAEDPYAALRSVGYAGIGMGMSTMMSSGSNSAVTLAKTADDAMESFATTLSSQADEVGLSNSAWRSGRYSEAASKPGAYWASDRRVFPTNRNSGLTANTGLREAQTEFAARRLGEGAGADVVRGQAASSGLSRVVDDMGDRLLDKGAENAVQKAIEAQNQ